jgi:glycosyltransferase involved in cell wall biosynthesis
MKPTLSVLMPNYNHAAYVGRAIEAIVSQSRPPDELLVLDDGSTDDSVAIIGRYSSQYPVIRFLRNESNQGVVQSANRLLAEARGNYVYGAAADDYVLPAFFEKAMALGERHPQAGAIMAQYQALDDQGAIEWVASASAWKEPMFVEPARFLHEYLEAETPSHSLSGATIYRRSCLDEIGGFPVQLGSWCDTFAIRAIGLRYGVCYLPHVSMTWMRHRGSVAARTGGDPIIYLRLVERATRLMRTSPFSEWFPPEHVSRWAKRYQEQIFGEENLRLRSQPRRLGRLRSWFADKKLRTWARLLRSLPRV